jgi:hypothetical protein
MDGLIRLFKEVDGQTLFISAVIVLVALGIIGDVIVKIVRKKKE